MSSIFTQDTSAQDSGGLTFIKNYYTKDYPNISFYSKAGIYNSADNIIKIFTNNIDALTIDANQKVICNGSLITNLDWNKIDGKPTNFPTSWDNVSGKPSIFATNWDNVSGKPSIFPTNWDNVASKPTYFQTDWDTTVLNKPLIFTQAQTSNIFTTYNVIQNTQDLISYSKLSGRPSLANVATSGLYNDLSGRPSLATVATSGLFNDLNGRPSVYPTDWTNVSGKPTNFQSDWNTTVINKPTNFQSDWNSTIINRPDIFTKTETSNNFTTLTQSNILYNNIINNTNSSWILSNNNLYNLNNNIGIGLNNPSYKLDVNGIINASQFKLNSNTLFEFAPANAPTFINGTQSNIDTNNYYIQYITNGTLTIPVNMSADVLVVAAGGKGGISAFSGGGGAGEVVYYPNLQLLAGVYNINVGIDSSTPANRISKLRLGATDIITAIGGGNGGLYRVLFSTTTGIIINGNCFYKFNDDALVAITPATYNVTFGTGTITLLNTNTSVSVVDKSYPVIRNTTTGANINPDAWYKFDNNTNIGLDSMGVANMTNNGSVTTTTGIKGSLQAVFNGTTNYLSTTTFPNINSKSFSFTFWCKATAVTTQTRPILGYNLGASGVGTRQGLMLYMGAGNQFIIRFGSDDLVYTSPSTYQNRLVFFAITFNITGFVQKLYENGVEVATRNAGGGLSMSTPGSMAIGRRNYNNTPEYFGGEIDDFRVYNNRVLTVDEINEIYKGRFTFSDDDTSGGSGGGGGGGNTLSIDNQTGAVSGTPFDVTYSKLTTGANGTSSSGGNGGSALLTGRYTDLISGLQVGGGGSGANGSSTPVIKTNYGDGGDGNGGNGFQGIVLLKFQAQFITKFLEYANYDKLYNKPNLLSQEETSNIFITSNLLLNNYYNKTETSNVLSNSLNNYFTKDQTSNIFITSNDLLNVSNLNNYYNIPTLSNVFTTNSNSSNFQYVFSNALQLVNNNVINNYYTRTQTSNIFVSSNVIQNSVGLIDYNKLANIPPGTDLSGYFTKTQTSNIFVTSNIIQNSVGLIDYNKLANIPPGTDLSGYFTKNQTSNIFVSSNVIQNSVGLIDYNKLANLPPGTDLSGYFNKTQTSNIFVTSNVIQNSVGFIDYNNLANKPTIGSGAGQFWSLDAPTNVIYNNNTNGSVVVNGTTINNGYRFKVNGNIWCDGSNIKLSSSTSGNLMSIQFQDSLTGYFSSSGCSIYKIPTHEFVIMNYTTSRLFFGVGGNIRAILDNANNFSIGTAVSFPAARLHLNQTGGAEIKILMTDGNTGHTGTDGCAIIKQSDNHMNIMNYEANDIIFSTNGVERMRINSAGNLNVTNTATIATANITTDNITTANITTANITGNLKFPVGVSIRTNTDNNERFYFTSSGNSKYNSLTDHLFTINGVPEVTITNSGLLISDSLTFFTPTSMLHIHKASGSSDVMVRLTDGTFGTGATNGLVLWKDTNQDGKFWNYQNKALIFGTNNAERMRIKDNGYIGIGDTNCAGKLTIKSAYDNANDGIIINATDDGTANEKYMMKIYPYVVGSGQVGYRFRVINSPSGNTTDAISIDHTGRTYFNNEVNMKVNLWNRSSEGQNRLYYMNGGRTYFGSGDGYTWESSGGAAIAQLTNSGNFGLPYSGSTKLSVQSTTYTISSAYYAYFNASSGFNTNVFTYFSDVCAFFGSTIWVNSWIVSSSDERIKKEIEDINDDYALQKILAIQPKTYKYRDEVSKGNKRVYGFIAQQIKEVLPDAVKDDNKEIIPNIYKFYTISNDIITTHEDLRDKLKVGDKIQYFLEKSKEMRELAIILEITDSYIKIDKSYESNEKIFIYGSEVSDFHSISKEYIFTLNVCATQELYRIIQQQSSIINDLKNRIEFLENKLNI